MFMQLSVMMMFSGQSTWEMTRRRGDGGGAENRGVSASECERKWNRMGEVGDGRRQEGGAGGVGGGGGESTVTKEVRGKEAKSFRRGASV